MTETFVPIGQFAAAAQLSLKALRLYDENGLLPPARVDPDSGYRFYRVEQLEQATTIRLLRRAGMPIAEIRAFLAAPSPAPLEEYEQTIVEELADRRRVLRYVRQRLEEETMFEVKTKHVEAQPYVSRTERVRVPELMRFIVRTVEELRAAHEPTGRDFVLYHGAVNEEEDGPVEVCLPTATGAKELPAGEIAYTIATGGECEFPEILGAYEAVARWAKENGRQLDGPPREINDFGEGEPMKLEIAWPIR